ncbi:conserved hypothetical protein [Histoplasma capsulatum H143]|uniref:Uncharacterized protein n=1 Tax=Ajellomyces capsulatus (strain H143) TaxID=544712 RepID=C6H1X4_AJECH|nr:conserved hypothetical protein [Histoplasma capsulatum H143]
MSLVSYQQHDRDVARNWFETVLLAASCRSSVPPVWEAVQVLWEWMDAELVDEDNFDNAVPIGERRAWWEDMVAYLLDKVGWGDACSRAPLNIMLDHIPDSDTARKEKTDVHERGEYRPQHFSSL